MDTLQCICALVLLLVACRADAVNEKVSGTAGKYIPTTTEEDIHATSGKDIQLDDRYIYLQLLNLVQNLEKRDKEQQKEIISIRSELQIEKQRTSKLEEIIETLQRGYGKSNDDVDETPANADQRIQADADPIKTAEITRDARSEKQSDDPKSRIRREPVPVVAFQATLSYDLRNIGHNQVMAFNYVITNIGGAYNPHVGLFTAPLGGVYVFSTTLVGLYRDEFHFGIAKNGNIVVWLYLRGIESPFGSDSAMAVLHLNKGDDVVVKVVGPDNGALGGHKCMFSGFLLHEDQPSESIIGKK